MLKKGSMLWVKRVLGILLIGFLIHKPLMENKWLFMITLGASAYFLIVTGRQL